MAITAAEKLLRQDLPPLVLYHTEMVHDDYGPSHVDTDKDNVVAYVEHEGGDIQCVIGRQRFDAEGTEALLCWLTQWFADLDTERAGNEAAQRAKDALVGVATELFDVTKAFEQTGSPYILKPMGNDYGRINTVTSVRQTLKRVENVYYVNAANEVWRGRELYAYGFSDRTEAAIYAGICNAENPLAAKAYLRDVLKVKVVSTDDPAATKKKEEAA